MKIRPLLGTTFFRVLYFKIILVFFFSIFLINSCSEFEKKLKEGRTTMSSKKIIMMKIVIMLFF